MSMIHQSALELIGGTPMLRISRYCEARNVKNATKYIKT